MARKLSRREAGLLTVLVAALLAYLWYLSGSGPKTPASKAVSKQGTVAQKKASDRPPVVRMDLLTAKVEEYDPGGRDLFKYAPRPPSEAEVRRLREEAERRRRAAEEEAKRAALEEERRRTEQEAQAREAALRPPGPPPPPTPPPITLRFIGSMGAKDRRIAVLEDGKELLLAHAGEVVKGQYRVVDVRHDTVVMGFVRPEFKGQTRELPMVGK